MDHAHRTDEFSVVGQNMGLFTRPLMIGVILVALAMSLAVAFFLKRDPPESTEPTGVSPEVLPTPPVAPLPPLTVTTMETSSNPMPVDKYTTPKPVPETPPPAEVSWSQLNEQIRLLEASRVALMQAIMPHLPETPPTDAEEETENMPHSASENQPITPLDSPTRTELTPEKPTWLDLAKQMVSLEQQRQALIQLTQSHLVQPSNDTFPPPVPSNASAGQLTLHALTDNEISFILDEFKLNPMDTAESLNSHVAEMGYVFILKDVVFSSGSAELKRGHLKVLKRLARAFNHYANYPILIEGHTDNRGQADYNQDLSQRRALAVREALLNEGVDGSRIQVKAHGDLFPIDDNSTEIGRANNRRVEITLLTHVSMSELKTME
ncbi:OmpA family protein [Thioflexithrix psekupsensis]|uniref:OmpA-like domain-containing protein n=1 Tax=Thioflexithrix psekupsensis TaxID=1570016 RepID=A0A251X9B5_9GAMM|nr:OmpA family protein [Thioflexithrix psekupsensis]OUD14596.1 hypothetical protein TPSD3_09950 [Thioflexithrix psekupsensis]